MGIFIFLLCGTLAFAGPLEDELIHQLAEAEGAGTPRAVSARIERIIAAAETRRAREFLVEQLITSHNPGASLALLTATEQGKLAGYDHPEWKAFVVRASLDTRSSRLAESGRAQLRALAPEMMENPLFSLVLATNSAASASALLFAIEYPKESAPALLRALERESCDPELARFAHSMRMTGDPPVVAAKWLPLLFATAKNSDRARALLRAAGEHGFESEGVDPAYRHASRRVWANLIQRMKKYPGVYPVLARHLANDTAHSRDAYRTARRVGLIDGQSLPPDQILAAVAESAIPELSGAREIGVAKDAVAYAAALAKIPDEDPVMDLALAVGMENGYGAAFERRIAIDGSAGRLPNGVLRSAETHFLSPGADPENARRFWQMRIAMDEGGTVLRDVLDDHAFRDGRIEPLLPILAVVAEGKYLSLDLLRAVNDLPNVPPLRLARLNALHAFLPKYPEAFPLIAAWRFPIGEDGETPESLRANELTRSAPLSEAAKVESLFHAAITKLAAGFLLPTLAELAPRDPRLGKVVRLALAPSLAPSSPFTRRRAERIVAELRACGVAFRDLEF